MPHRTSPNALELHYRLVVQGMEEGVVFHDEQGVIRSTNPSAERILGVAADALLGRRSVLERCNPVTEAVTEFSLENCPALVALRQGQSARDVIIGIRDAAGVRWLSFASHPLLQADGSCAGVVTSFRDITELKERETLSMQRYLDASASVRRHDAFLATAAHELRTPLTALKLQVQLLLRSATKGVGLPVDVLGSKLRSAVRQTERLGALVDLLLDVSRITAGMLELNRVQMDLSQLVSDLLERHAEERVFGEGEISIDLEPATGNWDPARLEQVVSNLLSNAVKYGNHSSIHIGVKRLSDGVLLTVRDEGAGIPQTAQSRIFERFERANGSNEPGMGLGLWIVREVVDAHGGRINLHSVEGRGSTFSVWLPS